MLNIVSLVLLVIALLLFESCTQLETSEPQAERVPYTDFVDGCMSAYVIMYAQQHDQAPDYRSIMMAMQTCHILAQENYQGSDKTNHQQI
jgi:hypothetical protein